MTINWGPNRPQVHPEASVRCGMCFHMHKACAYQSAWRDSIIKLISVFGSSLVICTYG